MNSRFAGPGRIVVISLLLHVCSAGVLLAENWPQFRGPGGQGISTEKGLPVHWGVQSNLLWKTEIPGLGWSSPIVFENRIFVTSAAEGGLSCRVLCLDSSQGRLLWNKEVFQQTPSRKESKNSYATPTPVTDGKNVFVVFGDGSLAALSFDGSVIWTNRDYKFYSRHGFGASPILYQDLLIMPYDGSIVPGDGVEERTGWQLPWDKSYLVALDIKTGKLRWKAMRGMSRIAHVTPSIGTIDGRPQLVSGAGDVVQGFDLSNGAKIWWIYSKGEGVVPSIVIGDGLIFSASGFEDSTIRAIRTKGTGALKGDVTRTHIAWEQKKGVPSLPSFLFIKPYLFTITQGGIASCLKEENGEVVWQERIGGDHSASPIWADGKIYFLSEQGETAIIEAGPEFKIVARNTIEDKCQASMAVSKKNLLIRSEKALYCIGKK